MFRIHQTAPPAGAGAGGAPDGSGTVQVFRWRGADDYFMITGDSYIAMGGGGAYAWMLDSEFRHGTSGPCSTFESPQLTKTHSFELNEMEVWSPIRDFDIDEDGRETRTHAALASAMTERDSEQRVSRCMSDVRRACLFAVLLLCAEFNNR